MKKKIRNFVLYRHALIYRLCIVSLDTVDLLLSLYSLFYRGIYGNVTLCKRKKHEMKEKRMTRHATEECDTKCQ